MVDLDVCVPLEELENDVKNFKYLREAIKYTEFSDTVSTWYEVEVDQGAARMMPLYTHIHSSTRSPGAQLVLFEAWADTWYKPHQHTGYENIFVFEGEVHIYFVDTDNVIKIGDVLERNYARFDGRLMHKGYFPVNTLLLGLVDRPDKSWPAL